MILKMYMVHDIKAGLYAHPNFLRKHAEAIRAFDATIADRETKLAKNPEDFAVVYVGEFDDETGIITAPKVQEVLTTGLQAKARLAEENARKAAHE